MNRLTYIIVLFLIMGATACKKDSYGGLSDSAPAIPVTVSNLYGFFNYPTVVTSLAGGGAISIKLEIPASSGRTIKEITRVALGSSGANYKVAEVSTGLYNTAPIPGSGTSVTFTTSLTEYSTKSGLAAPTAAAAGTTTAFLARYFYFLVTLDDGQTIIPVATRVYVNP